LSHTEPFKGRTTWSDLEMVHYQIMFLHAFDKIPMSHPIDDLSVGYKEPFISFRFLASAAIKHARVNGVTGMDLLSVSRPREDRITMDFRRTYRFDFQNYSPPIIPKVPLFQVVVDNTKAG
jgi:hypothetical protein